MKTKVLQTHNLCKKIKNQVLVNNVNLSLYEGDILGFLGPNGAGKSTTIKMILGLVKPTSGEVEILNYNISTQRESALKSIGAMVEYPSFYPNMSGFENLKLYAGLYNLNDNRVNAVLDLVNLKKDSNKKFEKYSMGMKQRLGIARAFLHSPRIVILDEPTNGLDPEGVIEIRNLIIELAQKQNITFLISSHILGEIQTICNKVAIIKSGSILAQGETETLLKDNGYEKLEDYYLSIVKENPNV